MNGRHIKINTNNSIGCEIYRNSLSLALSLCDSTSISLSFPRAALLFLGEELKYVGQVGRYSDNGAQIARPA